MRRLAHRASEVQGIQVRDLDYPELSRASLKRHVQEDKEDYPLREG